ncbi:hypothetical protein F0562_008272 [Nyssa sinensis]|uniref:Cellulose synthase-like protein H1 n=1 Tax=Nyssa sinensis TaxID=561372 RepID=A0A5J5A601_9ASTE|nr:hypothetical protein F0562_008272 [Nyssa sinensis]
MFVTTADPILEPPIITVNTVLSLLAVDYPANKLACYVSDDGCSPLTFYALVEASKFAKLWVPFCKKYNIQVRAPFRYFSGPPSSSSPDVSSEFRQEWKKMKVIWENTEAQTKGLPHLVYISREKRPKHPHHFKAGAMNVLSRVSGVMTNAPFMLNVDCDMYANNPQIVLQAMCVLLGVNNESDAAFVQYPQRFYGALKDDPFGNQFVVLIHVRKLSGEDLQKEFGNSKVFTKLAAQILSGLNEKTSSPHDFLSSIEAAYHVAGCGYEYGTSWGTKVGWIYGSATEDVLTGLTIHGKGWKTVYCSPDPPAFLGFAPSGGPASLTQQKRWATGLLEILFSSRSPFIATIFGKLQFRQCLAYMWILVWALRSIPELCYAALPAYCIITNSHFMPQVQEPAIFIPIALFIIYNLYTLSEYLQIGLSVHEWWNNQRMLRIISMTARLFGVLSVILKLLGLSETMFEVTQKDQTTTTDDSNANAGRFTFDGSSIFVPGTTILLINMIALAIGLLGFLPAARDGNGSGIGEFICSVWVVLCFWAFLKGLFGKGKYGIPSSTICKSGALALLFVHFCKWTSRI